MTTFAPIAAGGVNTQPITSFTYRNVGVNIECNAQIMPDDRFLLKPAFCRGISLLEDLVRCAA